MPAKYISPWPRADAQRHRASVPRRNTLKQPEPPPKPKPRQKLILGLEVDQETYHKYQYDQSYTIDGDALKGISCSLWSLENYYATEEHEREYPVEAANARKVLNQIREEVAAIMNRKDNKNMREPKTATDFIAALNDIYTESRSAYTAMQSKEDQAKEKMEQAQKALNDPSCDNRQLAQIKYDVAKGEYQIAVGERHGEIKEIQDTHAAKIKALRDGFEEYLSDYYAASPDKLDPATMQLLSSGICTASDLERLVTRHMDNPTMLRVVGNYARNMRKEKGRTCSSHDQLILSTIAQKADAAKDGGRELAIFDSAASATEYGLSNEYSHATRMHSYIPSWMDSFSKQMEGLSAELTSGQ